MATFRVNKTKNFTVMANHHLRDRSLSIGAKGLLSLMLSLPEDWDYSLRGLSCINGDGVTAISSAVKELEEHGYIIRTRERDERGRLHGVIYDIFEFPQREDELPKSAQKQKTAKPKKPAVSPLPPKSGFPDAESPDAEKPDTENQPQRNNNQIIKNQPKKKGTNTQSHPIGDDEMDEMESRLLLRDSFCRNIAYDILTEEYDRDEVEELVELVMETMCTNNPTVRVAKDEIPTKAVRSRLLKLTYEHFCYVLDCLAKNTTKVHNIKAYQLTALYNAPITMQSFYRSEVSHDFKDTAGGAGKK